MLADLLVGRMDDEVSDDLEVSNSGKLAFHRAGAAGGEAAGDLLPTPSISMH